MTDQSRTLAAAAPEAASLDDIAMQWLMRVSDPDAGADLHVACARWRAADPAHEQAFAAAQLFWQRDELALALEHSLHAPRPSAWREGLRPFGLAMAAMLLLAVLAGGTFVLPQARHVRAWVMADERAPLHRIAATELADGSRLTLDAGAAVDVDDSPTQRRLKLLRGTIVIEAAPDSARPMVVTSGQSTVTVVGTRFLVSRNDANDRIDVQSGRVDVQAYAGGDAKLMAGQRVRASAAGVSAIEAIDPNSVADFAAGWRSFERVPLQEVLAEISRYRWTPVLLDDPVLEAMPVTARLQVSEPDRALAALLVTMPLQLREWPGGTVRIEARRPKS
jgi:transmembrane sensor